LLGTAADPLRKNAYKFLGEGEIEMLHLGDTMLMFGYHLYFFGSSKADT